MHCEYGRSGEETQWPIESKIPTFTWTNCMNDNKPSSKYGTGV